MWFIFFLLTFLAFPNYSFAHAFGRLYNLPVPFWLYLYGAAAAIIVSFLIIGFFINQTKKDASYTPQKLFKLSPIVTPWLKAGSIFFFLLTIIAGLVGIDNSSQNFNMTFFWVIFILGMTYFTAIFGDIYSVINPWKTLVEYFEKFRGKEFTGFIKYPEKLAYYPALNFYFLFILLELLGQTTPFKLSLAILVYSLITFTGVLMFGKKWLSFGEFFAVFFSLIARISPLGHKKGLLSGRAGDFSLLLFILFMLSSTSFDGFRETKLWIGFAKSFLESNSYQELQIVALFISPFVFLFIYLFFLFLGKLAVKSSESLQSLSLYFAFTLIPIAFVYNLSHYYTLFLTQGQEIIRLISDPFGFGWNLFGTYNFRSNLFLIDANVTWHLQVAFILLGHIAAVYFAHLVSLRVFPSRRSALFSQFPVLILMITYTIIGLWILSQPIGSQ